ncbi:Histone methylation protein DOT1 [Phytophthora palmivora]|uniref:Histone methylation protein DOT1 n=1 Tax=Phytophthora palmivora TaxID=4796 RepID=A0A2P4XV74_9STRA|nr:Histone methylation protein DOT1 [Phytophthora palmivora]
MLFLEASLLEPPAAMKAIAEVFRDVSSTAVHQHTVHTHENAGECIVPVNDQDIFLDIGAGIVNVIAQVALTSSVKKRIEIEVRDEMCKLGEAHIRSYTDVYPLPRKATMIASDLRDLALFSKAPTYTAIIVFDNNSMFEELTNLVLSQERCSMFTPNDLP